MIGGKTERDWRPFAKFYSTSLIVTFMLPRVAFEYGQVLWASSIKPTATARATPGRPTLRRALRKQPLSATFRSTSASIVTPAGRAIFFRWAANPIAVSKQADQAAANRCSELVPMRFESGTASLTSKRPSELREMPCSRPPVVRVLAVYTTFEISVMGASFLVYL